MRSRIVWRRLWALRCAGPPRPRAGGRMLQCSAGAAALGTAAFVQASRHHGQQTGEHRMLEMSRQEMRHLHRQSHVPDSARGLRRLVDEALLLLELWIWEPLCTAARFLQLVVIFVPVVVAVPAVYIGPRRPRPDADRLGSGALWWFGLVVGAMERAGPAFIKLGQWAASRSDIFPADMCDMMSRLHSNAPAHSLEATRATIQAAFGGRCFDDIFQEFVPEPLGVGAIAQVYRAKLKPDLAAPADCDIHLAKSSWSASSSPSSTATISQNVRRNVDSVLKSSPRRVPSSYVAVKVLHPHVERTVRRDLKIMAFFAAIINAIPTMEWLSLPGEVAQFGEMMKLQLDLRIEAANLTRFRQNFKHRATAWFPYPYTEFTTRNVLVEEFTQGIPLADFMQLGAGVFQHDIADQGLDSFLRMLLLDNFVHADLHPGNIMVRFYEAAQPSLLFRHPSATNQEPAKLADDVTEKVLQRLRPLSQRHDRAAWDAELSRIDSEGYRPQLLFIDTGLVTELSEINRTNFLDLFRAIADFDGYRAGNLMCQRCRQPDAVIDKEVFALKMQHLVLDVKSRTLALGSVRIGDVLQRVLSMVRQHHVRLEGDFVNVVISILLLEGIGRSLDPDVDLLSSSLPILRQVGAQSGAQMAKHGDFSFLLVWMGLETRKFLQASVEDVERCVKYDLLSPNV
ncbi:hypothetical protein CDD81_7015 [Ophiocordyceps australis]|uniref:ABC1 atypical kinase-like domain-containing protein n=1 Tax=Ophiocordyceps australis TaxID=1399860 RepID=A0A2C5YGC1_9HYPO|nr:hypothetical protein CDD81_7015 [Ophiocordyceps australis]